MYIKFIIGGCMTLRHLMIFIAVYETLSFTKAGKKMRIAQPAVSLAIKELEEYYQVCLFNRIKNGVHATKQGELLYQYASNISTMMDEMEGHVASWKKETSIRIGSSITIGIHLLPDLVAQFQERFPEIQIEVTIANANTIEEEILQNKIDFALIENKSNHKMLSVTPFMQDKLCTIAHPSHPLVHKKRLKLTDFNQVCFLAREEGSSVRTFVDSLFALNQVNPNIVWQSTSTQAITQAVQKNLGVTTLPYRLISRQITDGHVVELDVPQLNVTRQYNIVYYKGKHITKVMQTFMDHCIIHAAEN